MEENLGQGSNERVGKLHETLPQMAAGGVVAGSHIEAPGGTSNIQIAAPWSGGLVISGPTSLRFGGFERSAPTDSALQLLCGRRHSFEHELLRTIPRRHFGGVQVALGIRG